MAKKFQMIGSQKELEEKAMKIVESVENQLIAGYIAGGCKWPIRVEIKLPDPAFVAVIEGLLIGSGYKVTKFSDVALEVKFETTVNVSEYI